MVLIPLPKCFHRHPLIIVRKSYYIVYKPITQYYITTYVIFTISYSYHRDKTQYQLETKR